MSGWWSRFTGVLPSMAFYPASRSCRYSSRLLKSEWWLNCVWIGTEKQTLFWSPCCAEPSLCSGGTRPRASSWRAGPGYVRRTWREDLPHRCTDGGSGTSCTEFMNSQLRMFAAPGLTVCVSSALIVGTSSTFFCVRSFRHVQHS